MHAKLSKKFKRWHNNMLKESNHIKHWVRKTSSLNAWCWDSTKVDDVDSTMSMILLMMWIPRWLMTSLDLHDDVDSKIEMILLMMWMVDDEPRSAWWWGSGRWDFAALGVRIAWLKGSHLYRPPPLLLNLPHLVQAQTQNKINTKSTNTYISHHPFFWICPT